MAPSLSPCPPSFAFPRAFGPLLAHAGACLKVSLPLSCKHVVEADFRHWNHIIMSMGGIVNSGAA